MVNQPKVTIVMATYNGEKFIKKQLESILTQSYKNFELIICDDKSTDTTQDILHKYAQQYQNIVFFINRERIGVVKNFEKLINLADSDYIACSDQDDIWKKDKLEIEMTAMLSNKEYLNIPSLVHSDLSLIDENDCIEHTSYFKYRNYQLGNKKDLGHILGPCGVMGNTLIINKKLKKLILPFPDTLDVHDYWIAIVCELFGKRITINQKLVKYRIHSGNCSNKKSIIFKSKLHFSRNIKLPNLETNRKYFLPLLLSNISNQKDKKILKIYLEYLEFKKNKFSLYYKLIRYSLVKKGFIFRIKLLVKFFVIKRY
jgi:rhamnosyltransferase